LPCRPVKAGIPGSNNEKRAAREGDPFRSADRMDQTL
jgi:hypothetical protein